MSKKSLALVSLIAAVPALVLTIMLAASLLSSFGNMPGSFVGLVGIALLASSFTAVLPVGIVLFGGKEGATAKAPKPPKEKKEKKKKGKKGGEEEAEAGAPMATDEVDVLESGEIAAAESGLDEEDDTDFVVATPDAGVSTGELDIVEGAFTEDNLPEFRADVSDDNLDVFEEDAMEDFGFEVEDDDDEQV